MAIKRLQKELTELQQDEGCQSQISAEPVDSSSWFLWHGVIYGAPDSVYAGGLFHLEIRFPLDYPFKPPEITFKTKVYHPNINSQGKVCKGILDYNNWSPALTIRKVLLSVSGMLTDPNIDDPLEPQIAQQYKTNRKLFDETAREWTQR